MAKLLGSKISGHSMTPGTSFRRSPESSVIHASTGGRHLGSGFHRSDEYVATGPIDALDTGSKLLGPEGRSPRKTQDALINDNRGFGDW